MGKKRIYGLDRDQIGHLLSLGTDGTDTGDEKSNESAGAEETRPERTASLEAYAERPGGWVGRYKLLRVLGEGGMGLVFLAQQEHAIQRQVALKVIKPGMDSRRVISHFKAERQALALLDHPNIAHVYDAGTTDSHRPYFVMEYVKGLPITAYCDKHKLTIDDRLGLFQQVCHAVQHAHQKGIIHRDLKPSNILVTVEGDRSIPKIIDFGVAKAVSRPLADGTLFTEDTQLLGTPEYMSPEQADLANEDVDTRSDIYSLGVLLYELVTGTLPFDAATLRQAGIDHVRRIIRETDPKTPSTRLTKLGAEAGKVAESRRTEVASLVKRLRQELEWIPLKAMRKERAERYRSASELADDIENYQKGAPLMAGPPTAGYRLKKFLRRHKALVGSLAAVLVVSVVGTIVSLSFALGQARALAETQALADYLYKGILQPIGRRSDQTLTAHDVLDTATENLEGRFEDYPLTEASIRYRLGSAYYYGLQDFKAAELQLEYSRRITQEQLGPEYGASYVLGLAYGATGRITEAASVLEAVVEDKRRSGKDEPWHYLIWTHLANVYVVLGRYDEAEQIMAETWTRHVGDGEDKPFLPRARIYFGQGRYEEAKRDYLRVLEDRRPSRMAMAMTGLAKIHMEQNHYPDANGLLVSAIRTSRGVLTGRAEMVTLDAVNHLAVLRTRQGHFDEAERLFNETWEAMKEIVAEDDLGILQTVHDFGVLRREQGRYEEAKTLLTQALEGRRQKLGPDCPTCSESKHELALVYVAQKDYGKAAPLLLNAYNGRETKLGPDHPRTIESLRELVTLYESWGKPEEAAKWRAKLPHAEAAEEQN